MYKAFSIIELLLVLLILGILLLIALPFGRDFFEKNRALAYANELRSALRFARFSAIKLGEPVRFCGSSNFKTCDGLWQKGRIIVTDSEKVIRTFPSIFSGDRIKCNDSFGRDDGIKFLPTGYPNGMRGSFHYCPNGRSENALATIFNIAGRVRISTKDSRGRRINCSL